MGAYTELVDFTFTANETSRTFSGLSITKDDFVKVVVNVKNPNANTLDYRLFPNSASSVSGFDNNANYTTQTLGGFGSSALAFRGTRNRLAFISGNNKTGTIIAYVKISENGKYNSFANNTTQDDTEIQTIFEYTTSHNLTFNDAITSLTLQASATNGLGTGSRIQIYRLDAVKVADFVTTSNSTQVDIPFPTGTFSPAIDKDSEYLLVSDFANNSILSNYMLTINDVTTLTNYYYQAIFGSGSSTGAARDNSSRIAFVSTDANRTLAYTHIKLSNIGAYTHQSYNIFNYGTSDVGVSNNFASSTAENITSITKLNIIGATNGIGTGSRFTLYKLYE